MENKQAGVWVKASERLPDEDGEYAVRSIGKEYKISLFYLTRYRDFYEWLDEQPIPVNQDEGYWQKRCEAAEKLLDRIPFSPHSIFEDDLNAWQQLKSSPSPTPVNDREDDEINNYYMSLFEGEADHHAGSFHSIEDYDRVYRAVLHGCKFGFQERQKEIDVLDKAHDTTIEQLRMAQDERNKWKEMYESLTTTPIPIQEGLREEKKGQSL